MKLTHIFSLCAATFTLSASVFAGNTGLSHYSSSMHPNTSTVLSNLLHPPTDITIINASADYFYAIVPNSPINDYITPGYNDHIYNYDPSAWNTYIVLQDPYYSTFYTVNACSLAIITVRGYVGNFRINIDSDLCY